MSNSTLYSFGKLPTLSTIYWTADKLKQSWKWRDRSMEQVMQRFIDLNKKNLDYLGITAIIENSEGKPALKLTTSKYIGAIPIISPMNGKAVGDLVVAGRFGENVGELLTLLDSAIKPDYSDHFKLVLDTQMTPPIFIECCKYIDLYIEADRFKWRKFTNEVKEQHQPAGSTLWGDYALRIARNPLEFNNYKNKCNTLTLDHDEWNQLNYVLTLAIAELESVQVPIKTRSVYASRISQLKMKLRGNRCEETKEVRPKMSDPHIIKQLKYIANIILNNKTNEKLAWRMDYAEFFERYVQFLFDTVAKKKGARSINNPHYVIRMPNKPLWTLSYLEPDLILQKANEQYVIDAKYKSHVFNWNDESNELKDTFRHDFHQVLAYCSLNNSETKNAMLIYPYTDFFSKKMTVISPVTHSEVSVHIVGIPLDKNKIDNITNEISNLTTI